jgi:hypothetical protein
MNPQQLREAGDWINRAKEILGQGPTQNRNVGGYPKRAHRSTKEAVTELLSNLREGASQTQDQDTTKDDIRKVVFNAVDLLIEDKTAMSKKGRTKLEALKKFGDVLAEEFTAQSKKRGGLNSEWKERIDAAVQALRIEELEKKIHGQGDIAEEMLATTENQKAMVAVLSAVDPASLGKIDLDTAFGKFKNDVLSETLLAIADKNSPLKTGAELDRKAQFDPTLFSKLAGEVHPDVWNDKGARKRGLGPRVCQALWENGNYDQICDLIRHGVDTSLSARVTGGEQSTGLRVGIYSGFVQPIQHVASNLLRDVHLLDTNNPSLSRHAKGPAQGAKKIFDALEQKGTAITLTKWADVKGSEMIDEFTRNPGTIWGFKTIRMPYVQAAHEAQHHPEPLRMIELWEAVLESLSPDAYSRLLNDPDNAIDDFVNIGVAKIEKGLTDPRKKAKYADIAKDSKTFIDNFKWDAKAFLTEFAARMPKGTFADVAKDDSGAARKDAKGNEVTVSDVAGIVPGKFMGGLACKAGLWWAKKEGKPVYYCLDGINMDDVTNYKKVKNKAIEDFIAAGGQPSGAKGHDEVITMVELREILKNWEELEDTVKFVRKAQILKGNDLEKEVKAWQAKMKQANQEAGRAPAPPRAAFAKELKAIDPRLMAKLPKGPEGDKDARDIVRKSGYLLKVANSRPEIVLKYIMSRCKVLTDYDLIPIKLPEVAAKLAAATAEGDIPGLSVELRRQITRCNAKFQLPLKAALMRHPLLAKKTAGPRSVAS